MPNNFKVGCKYPGCPNLITTKDKSYCEIHKKYRVEFTSKKRHGNYGYRWQKYSRWYLKNNPLCVNCKRVGLLTPATDVDHIIPIAEGGDNSQENLQALCKRCHSRKTAKEIRGRKG